MKAELWWIGKTKEKYLQEGIAHYQKRLKRYLPFQVVGLPDIKGGGRLEPGELKRREGEMVMHKLQNGDLLILLDESGHSFTSVAFAKHLDRSLQRASRRLIFLIGGAYGFSPDLYGRADEKLSLSEMTFSHQMIRLFFLEQLYRAMTILRNEPYHNA